MYYAEDPLAAEKVIAAVSLEWMGRNRQRKEDYGAISYRDW